MGQRGIGAKPKRDFDAEPFDPVPWDVAGLSRSAQVITFLEWLPITKGKLAETKMKLLPFQVEFIEAIYGEVGKRPYKQGVQSVPRGQGKTGLLAGLALCHMVGPESEKRGEVFCAALDSQQAGILFQEVEAIVREVPRFESCINVIRHFKKMEVLQGPGQGSTLQCMSRDAKKAHGLAPSFWIYDELAQTQDNGELLRNLQTGMGKRNESLGIIISTQAPNDQHILSQMIDEPDENTYVQVICAPEGAEITDEEVLACNPAVDAFLDREELLIQAERARKMRSFESSFRNLRMNQRISAEAGFVDQAVWKLNSKNPLERAFVEGQVYIGLDLSLRDDLTALVMAAFYENAWHVRPFFWVPGDVSEKSQMDRVPYDVWAREGLVYTCSGPTIDYETIAIKLVELSEKYNPQCIAFDRWGIHALNREFVALGVELPLKEFGQGFKSMAPALNTLSALLLNSQIRHGNNPPLTMCAANAVVETDAVNNRKFTKPRSRGKIDGMVALAMAIGISEISEPEVLITDEVMFA